ncbi:uncharacterized protein LOC135947087 [Cloeon dipterum]|uniref:uncharacterized protein LOC135947087 n=1 Tax=Cloeon dipterum TaxID=197152 RepID=UPI00321FBC3D
MSILTEILSGLTICPALLINDKAGSSGREIILEEFMRKFSRNGTKVVVLNLNPLTSQDNFDPLQNVTTVPVFPDSKSWLECGSSNLDLVSLLPTGSKCAVLIDSLDSALLKFGAKDLYLQLNNLKSRDEVIQLICVLQEDIADQKEIAVVRPVFSTIISVCSSNAQIKYPSFELQHYKSNGKYFTEKRILYKDPEGNLKIQPITASETPAEKQPTNVHDNISTFRHGLNTEELKARENLVLPYQRMTLDNLPLRGQGKIEYEPEESDTWDEMDDYDPDDDLEI